MTLHESQPAVHLVDDDGGFLKAMSRLLRAAGHVVRTYSSAQRFLEEVTDESHGCAIVDLQMPMLSGLELQDALAQRGCEMPLVFLTGQGDIPSSVRALKRGAEDFLTKTAPKEQVLDAVNRAMERDGRQRGQRAYQKVLSERFSLLTAREREVLEHVLEGELNKQIAIELGIHERTVKLHRTAITTKLQVHSVAELSRLAQEAGLFKARPQCRLPDPEVAVPPRVAMASSAAFPKGQ